MLILGIFLVSLGAQRGPLGPEMVDLGCQDTDWIDRNDKNVLRVFSAG